MTPRTPTPAPSATSGRTPAAEVEAAVLDAAERLVADAGPAALTIRKLATDAHVAPMSIYNRFGDKAGVLEALFTRGFEELHGHTGATDLIGGDPSAAEALDRLRTCARSYRSFATRSPGTYSLMFDRAAADFEPTDAALEVAGRSFNALVDLVAQAQRAGALVGGSPAEVAQRLWASLHGAVSLELRSICFVDDTDAHFDALVDTLLIGMAPDRGIPGIADVVNP
ncbi:TetR/AcrR family transcriptional regulator [Aquihabitans sp. McL0605]|uniref:TetR/AcrR family transcriptional regulator n=1 Tax=Aquihabitans sp. McL0605 TaxID=3415671 RepID=UPI003CFB6782